MSFRCTTVTVAVAGACLLLARPAQAHNPDTSYTKVRLSSERLELRFTFDLETLPRIAPLDGDGDGAIRRGELLAQGPAIQAFLARHVKVTLDGRPIELGAPEQIEWPDGVEAVPAREHQATLIGFVFGHRLAKLPDQLGLVYDIFDALGERHTHLGSIEQGAHGVEQIVFTRFEPDYTYFPEAEKAPAPARRSGFAFVKLGIEHIFLGYDHILFLLALLVVSRLRELVRIVTSFTIAHSITLILAALEIVRLPGRLIEVAIAASIVYVAVENLWIRDTRHRWILTFAFGLVHGFGFANVLREMQLPREGLVRSLLAFNVGVELGQLAIVAVLFPVAAGVARVSQGAGAKRGLFGNEKQGALGPPGRRALSVAVGAFGAAWLVERAFGLRFMPF